MQPQKKNTLLCLGDSYTIGEAVEGKERFPEQAVQLLHQKGYPFEQPVIIAKTGWTTDELAAAIAEAHISSKFDFVTLLIGVNNQYRGRDTANYRLEFVRLLKTAIAFASGNSNHVFVFSIPDWGATPFVVNDVRQRTRETIAAEIDAYNSVNREEAIKHGVHYIDITPISRKALQKPELTAADGLHPSGLMYKEWAEKLVEEISSSY